MYFLGHFALGFFLAKLVSCFSKEEVNIPLIWVFSILPDVDVFIPFIIHRGPTHSIVFSTVIFSIFLIKYQRGYIYYAAFVSHVLGDYFTSYGCKIFWPSDQGWYNAPDSLMIKSQNQLYVETFLFLLMLVMIRLKPGKRS